MLELSGQKDSQKQQIQRNSEYYGPVMRPVSPRYMPSRVTKHQLIVGSCRSIPEVPDDSVHLMVTSPPYFNAPFDYPDKYQNYEQFLSLIRGFAEETFRVLKPGRIAVVNVDDMLVKGEKYPIVSDTTNIFNQAGFRYRDRIIWKKPDGYLRISRRSGVLLQHPYPMYFYPDNLLESILIFQKGKFDYKSVSQESKKASKIDINEFQQNGWYKTLWSMTNVLPGSKLEKDIAAFPEELPYRIVSLFSFRGETVLDPFVGSGTTMKVCRNLGRHSVGIEVEAKLVGIIKRKLGVGSSESDFFNPIDFKLVNRPNVSP